MDYKVGDPVRIISNVNRGEFPIGFVGKIKKINREHTYITDYTVSDAEGEEYWYYTDKEIELA